MKKSTLLAFALLLGIAGTTAAESGEVIYQNDFQSAEAGKLPEGLQIQDGQFAVKADGTNKVLELPGAPLETFGTLFGPTQSSNVTASAVFFGTGKGRRFPTFGIGLNGVAGFRLQVSPGKKLIELYNGDEVIKSVPSEWKSGEWTHLLLRNRATPNGYVIEGKAWPKGAAEPAEWQISAEVKTVVSGKASIWGSPFSGTPIQFDDLRVSKLDAN